MKYLSKEAVLAIHKEQLIKFGGLPGVRDDHLLESAIAMPMHDYHKTVFDKASAYLFHVVKNHPFNDGNKRVGTQSMNMFLLSNGVKTEFDEDELEKLVMDLASGKDISNKEIAEFIMKYSKIV